MSDLISTQDSVAEIIDTAIRKILNGEQKLTKEYEQSVIEAVDVILNTARRTDGDLVSREAVLDALYHVDEYNGRSVEAIRNLPSAQTEVIRCKECVYADENYHCVYMTTWNNGDCFCCYAERRTNG